MTLPYVMLTIVKGEVTKVLVWVVTFEDNDIFKKNPQFIYSRLWWLIPSITIENRTNQARQKSNAFDTYVYHSTPSRQTQQTNLQKMKDYLQDVSPLFHKWCESVITVLGQYHLTCRPSGGRDCCSSVFPSRSSSSRAEFPGVEPEDRGWEWEAGSGLRRRLGAAGMSASMLSED